MADEPGPDPLSLDERLAVLREIADRPLRMLMCVDRSFSPCPIPAEVVALGFDADDAVEPSGGALVDVSAAEKPTLHAVIGAARRTGIGMTEMLLENDVQHVGVCMVDLTTPYGVYVVVAGDILDVGIAHTDPVAITPRPRRLLHYRDDTARFIAVDPETEAMLGWRDEDVLWRSALDFVHPDDHDRGLVAWLEMLTGVEGGRYRVRWRTPAGGYRWLELTNVNRLAEEGAGYVETEMVDVDDEMAALARVRAGEVQFRTLTESLPIVVVQIDVEGNLVYSNGWLRRTTGRAHDHGDPTGLSSIHADDRDRAAAAFVAAVVDGEGSDIDARLLGHGAARHCRVRVRPLVTDDVIHGAIASIEDITESASLQSKLRHQASTDHLTGLSNRMALIDGVGGILDSARGLDDGTRPAVLFVDLDGFKLVNDGLGHDAGDDLLVEVGERLRSTLRTDDLIARVGGDEFVIVCPWTRALDDAARLAERILDRVSEPFDGAGTAASVGCSIGIALHDGIDAMDAETLIGNADLAMYKAKRAGGSRWEPYGSELRSLMTERFEIRNGIGAALRNSEFRLHLLPIVDLSNGDVVGAECLVRWDHPRRGLLRPADFLTVAEESGQIVPLGRWILDEAFRIGAAAMSIRPGFRVAVNVSERQLDEADFAADFEAATTQREISPTAVILEVTESVFIDSSDEVTTNLAALAASGATLALDDFGIGYSSLNHLRRMPGRMVKIDASYTADLGSDADTTAIVESMADLGVRLGLEMVVEGVETVDQVERLQGMGFVLGQGMALAPVVDAETFLADLVGEDDADAGVA